MYEMMLLTQLKVSVKDFLFVQVFQSRNDLSQVITHLWFCQYFASLQNVGKRLSNERKLRF